MLVGIKRRSEYTNVYCEREVIKSSDEEMPTKSELILRAETQEEH